MFFASLAAIFTEGPDKEALLSIHLRLNQQESLIYNFITVSLKLIEDQI